MMAEAHGVSLVFTSGIKPVFVDGDVVRLETGGDESPDERHQVHAAGRPGSGVGAPGRARRSCAWRTPASASRAEHLNSIFELFAQAPTTLDRSRGGMGLGLTLVRALVELQGGTVAAHSDGDGFRAAASRSACRCVEAPAAADPRGRGRGDQERRIAGTGMRLVVVEDNVDVRETLVELLALEGHSVEQAADGPQGLTRIMSRARMRRWSTSAFPASTDTSSPAARVARSATLCCSSP